MSDQSSIQARPRRRRRGRPSTLDRGLLLKQAGEVIAERGLESTRYMDIADATGVPVTTLQGAFGSLQALLAAALRKNTEEEIAELEEVTAEPAMCAWDELNILMDTIMGGPGARRGWLLWFELWRSGTRDMSISRHVQALHRTWLGRVGRVVDDGVANGEFGVELDSESVARLIMSLVDGLAVTMIVGRTSTDHDHLRARKLASLGAAQIVELRD